MKKLLLLSPLCLYRFGRWLGLVTPAVALCLLPSLLWAGNGVTIKQEQGVPRPIRMVDRVLMRTCNSATYQDSAHFYRGEYNKGTFETDIYTESIHYRDGVGTWQRREAVEVADTTSEFTRSYKSGRFTVSINDSTGKFRYLRDTGNRRGSITFSPGFSPQTVPTEYSITRWGIKSTYTLNSGDRLAWAYEYTNVLDTTGAHGKGKGKVKDALGKIKAEVLEFIAWDATGRRMSASAEYKDDSLVVLLPDTIGFSRPFYIDPTIQDTASATASARLRNDEMAWAATRDDETATDVYAGGTTATLTRIWVEGNGYTLHRYAAAFPLNIPAAGSVVDSAKLVLRVSAAVNDSTLIAVARGTFTGATPAGAWFNDFQGWAASGVYAVTNMVASDFLWLNSADTTTHSKLFTAAARDTIQAKGAGDTLRLMLVFRRDINNLAPTGATKDNIIINPAPYMQVFYHTAVSTMTVVSDTLKAVAILVGQITSTGGLNATTRGFKFWPKGATLSGDTTTISESGSYAAGVFKLATGNLIPDTTYLYKSFSSHGGLTTDYSPPDSISTTITGGGGIWVDGRFITHIRP